MLFKTEFENYIHFTQIHDIEFKVPYGENQNAQSVYVFEQTSPIIQMKLKFHTIYNLQIMLLKTPNSEQKQGVIIDEKKNLN